MAETALDNAKIADALSQTYARSFFELASEDKVLDEVEDELFQLAKLAEQDASLRMLFEDRSTNATKRAGSIERIFKGKVSELTYRCLQVLNKKGRLDRLASIAVAFSELAKEARGEIDVEVYSALPLTEAQKVDVAKQIAEVIGKKPIILSRVDESLIGGLKIRIGDRIIDGSVSTQLRHMHKRMVDRGQSLIRKNSKSLIA